MRLYKRYFEDWNLEQGLRMCINSGYAPASLMQICTLIEREDISPIKYHTSSIFLQGCIWDAGKLILENIGFLYDNGTRLLYYDPSQETRIGCIPNLEVRARILGVKALPNNSFIS